MPRKLALWIGINDYPGTNSDLSGCVNDANDWAAAFKARGFAVTKLLDRAATGRAMRDGIARVVGEAAAAGDLVVVQYSGHGSFVPDEDGDEPDGTDECLCPHDVPANGPPTDDDLAELYAARAPGVRVLFVSDSCHSGTVARFAPITTPPPTKGKAGPVRKVRFLPPAAFLSGRDAGRMGTRSRRPASPPGRHHALLMSGCQDAEYSYDAWFGGRSNGAFTFVALKALAGLPASARYRDWYKAVRLAPPSQQYPQSPNLYGTSGMKSGKVLA